MCHRKIIFLFLKQNLCCGYSKEPPQWDGSFDHPKHMLKLMGKKIFTLLSSKIFVYLNLWYSRTCTCFIFAELKDGVKILRTRFHSSSFKLSKLWPTGYTSSSSMLWKNNIGFKHNDVNILLTRFHSSSFKFNKLRPMGYASRYSMLWKKQYMVQTWFFVQCM